MTRVKGPAHRRRGNTMRRSEARRRATQVGAVDRRVKPDAATATATMRDEASRRRRARGRLDRDHRTGRSFALDCRCDRRSLLDTGADRAWNPRCWHRLWRASCRCVWNHRSAGGCFAAQLDALRFARSRLGHACASITAMKVWRGSVEARPRRLALHAIAVLCAPLGMTRAIRSIGSPGG